MKRAILFISVLLLVAIMSHTLQVVEIGPKAVRAPDTVLVSFDVYGYEPQDTLFHYKVWYHQ